ncbi:hypothetical protein [Oceanobacillus sojae]|uniref:hypothetical protein n=1 Tax=Oceanobacillus sojae TaxID=582851 RepID=UPI00098879F4|nr:hypothetical protein [Oceanobacillus sojae]MCT1904873.1 hypothetical protein [Oceanobacillus sojae]
MDKKRIVIFTVLFLLIAGCSPSKEADTTKSSSENEASNENIEAEEKGKMIVIYESSHFTFFQFRFL